MTHLITGGAGCIGSELAGALLARGETVRVLDDLSSGRIEHIRPYMADSRFTFTKADILNIGDESLDDIDMVWHLSAKTDIKNLDPKAYDFTADYDQNLLATWTLLEAMGYHDIKRVAFASSAAVYGEGFDGIVREDMPLLPISMYGATKLACEAIIRALALRTGMQAWIFRYCSIVSGKARTSGNMVIPDLIHKLKQDPTRLEIYGDGNQTKPSLHVRECVQAMIYAVHCGHWKFPIPDFSGDVETYNIGAPDAISVTRQAELICEAMGVRPTFEYTGGAGGWPGDVPSFRMCVDKLAALGWRAQMSSEEAVREAIRGLLESGE